MQIYATVGDLVSDPWNVTDPPENVQAQLRLASVAVRKATRAAVYWTDALTGLPTDTGLLGAFKDATCAQVVAWIDAKIDPTSEGLSDDAGNVASKSLGGRSVSYTTTSTAVSDARRAVATGLAPEACAILEAAGLLGGQPATACYGYWPC